MIAAMIAKEYGSTDDESIILENEIITMRPDDKYYHGATGVFWHNDMTDADAVRALRAIDYSMSKTEDPEAIEEMEFQRIAVIHKSYNAAIEESDR